MAEVGAERLADERLLTGRMASCEGATDWYLFAHGVLSRQPVWMRRVESRRPGGAAQEGRVTGTDSARRRGAAWQCRRARVAAAYAELRRCGRRVPESEAGQNVLQPHCSHIAAGWMPANSQRVRMLRSSRAGCRRCRPPGGSPGLPSVIGGDGGRGPNAIVHRHDAGGYRIRGGCPLCGPGATGGVRRAESPRRRHRRDRRAARRARHPPGVMCIGISGFRWADPPGRPGRGLWCRGDRARESAVAFLAI